VCKVGEPFEEAVKKRLCRIIDFEWELNSVGDREELFWDEG
jgi:hypothetical protein